MMRINAKRRAAAAAFTALATAVTGFAVVAEASAATPSLSATAVATPRTTAPALNPATLQQAIAMRPGEAAAGAVALVRSDGQTWRGSAGDTQTGGPVADDAHFRIGSISKTFSAVVLLQLAAEHRVDLDQSVQQYLPGLLPATFQPITLRQLLNMTSGLPQIGDGGPSMTTDQLIAGRFEYQGFRQIIDSTLRPAGRPWPGPVFAPGTAQSYNSLNFRIVGLLIEHVTGHSFGDEVEARIVRPLHLTGTFVPQGAPRMPSPYMHGYLTESQGTVTDVSAAGGDPSSMISTTGDLNRFITVLFQGRLLPHAQLTQMLALPHDAAGDLLPYTGDSGNCQSGPDKGKACFGLGIGTDTLPDGTVLWGKTGEDMGYFTAMFATRDLRHVGIVSTGVTDVAAEAGLEKANRLAAAAFMP
ncbi:serine hydrolase domain-containing protein [Catenulispora rubra]|uniref:serine hydrolase domain-containing protein n=1 Tax=Catenulispora rubra TaxID=280293 RepID=UPI001E532C40|nr:serine hydrolase domain-containing protein [Catenulispora rubra]